MVRTLIRLEENIIISFHWHRSGVPLASLFPHHPVSLSLQPPTSDHTLIHATVKFNSPLHAPSTVSPERSQPLASLGCFSLSLDRKVRSRMLCIYFRCRCLQSNCRQVGVASKVFPVSERVRPRGEGLGLRSAATLRLRPLPTVQSGEEHY